VTTVGHIEVLCVLILGAGGIEGLAQLAKADVLGAFAATAAGTLIALMVAVSYAIVAKVLRT